MSRVYNFSAGPAVLPESVLQEAAAEMLDYRGTGMSVMEMSHRSKTYQAIIDQAEADLRTLMGIPDNYKVLFMQGGASQQFAMVPMNLMKNKSRRLHHHRPVGEKGMAGGQNVRHRQRCGFLRRQDLLLYPRLLRPAH